MFGHTLPGQILSLYLKGLIFYMITSRANPKIKEIIKLNDKKFRKQTGLYIVEGLKPVKECVQAGCEITEIICTEKYLEYFQGATVVSDAVFSVISSEKTPQGALATVKIPEHELKAPQKSCILLDCLQDPGNLGTIIRTANAAGYSELYLINCVDAYSPKVVRASMSGIFFTKIYSATSEEVLEVLKGVPLVCADMDGQNVFKFHAPEKFCLCIGNEGNGISKEIFSEAEYKVSIPMADSCESLNAAVSAGICMYLLKYNK